MLISKFNWGLLQSSRGAAVDAATTDLFFRLDPIAEDEVDKLADEGDDGWPTLPFALEAEVLDGR